MRKKRKIWKKLNGKYLGDFKDPNGIYLFKQMVQKCKKQDSGIVKYQWLNPKTKIVEDKISYVFTFEPFNWIIGTGEYISVLQKKLQNDDWVSIYQKSIKPLQIDNFYIHPTWDEPSDDLINIEINPALAFGTGHHPTTASSLRAISSYVKQDYKVLDVGCGSGILGVGALKLGAVVDACDTDIVSVENTLLNAKLNKVESTIQIMDDLIKMFEKDKKELWINAKSGPEVIKMFREDL